MSGRGRPFKPLLADISKGEMTVDVAHMLWRYDAESGLMFWRVSPRVGVEAGDVAGVISFHGYRMLCFRKKKHKAARVAWLMMTGRWPAHEIDHIDCNRANDSWANLREATPSQNKCNLRLRKDNALGIKGVCRDNYRGYAAYICFHGKRKNLGSYKTAEEAKAAYDTAASELHREFRRSA